MMPPVDPKDAFMLADAPMPSTNGTYASGGTPVAPQVSWLRKTEYISSAVNRTPTPTYDSFVTIHPYFLAFGLTFLLDDA